MKVLRANLRERMEVYTCKGQQLQKTNIMEMQVSRTYLSFLPLTFLFPSFDGKGIVIDRCVCQPILNRKQSADKCRCMLVIILIAKFLKMVTFPLNILRVKRMNDL